jgi:hypothetical protein
MSLITVHIIGKEDYEKLLGINLITSFKLDEFDPADYESDLSTVQEARAYYKEKAKDEQDEVDHLYFEYLLLAANHLLDILKCEYVNMIKP